MWNKIQGEYIQENYIYRDRATGQNVNKHSIHMYNMIFYNIYICISVFLPPTMKLHLFLTLSLTHLHSFSVLHSMYNFCSTNNFTTKLHFGSLRKISKQI